ncbi:hypothetical protein QDW16_gp17 [Microbacterium phage Quenya]|nr:hypothetical protein QDW16_gp17 [Microbacterium phage Quenya]QOP64287.1 hypothetical protein SEA_QUENYA_52 [Microbacterium phage Quenya]
MRLNLFLVGAVVMAALTVYFSPGRRK